MIVKKSNCNFSILDHSRLKSNMSLLKMIKMEFSVGDDNFKMMYTNAGWKEDNDYSWFCPKKFYPVEAEKFLFKLEEEILI